MLYIHFLPIGVCSLCAIRNKYVSGVSSGRVIGRVSSSGRAEEEEPEGEGLWRV